MQFSLLELWFCLRAYVSYFLSCTRKRYAGPFPRDGPFPRARKEIRDVCEQANCADFPGFSRIFFIRRRLLACLSHIRIYNGLIIVGRSCKRFISLRDLGEHKFKLSLSKSISRTATFRRFERDEIGFISYLQAPDHF